MGVCSCCPFGRGRKPSADSLSMDTQNPSIDVQLPSFAPKKSKRFDSTQLRSLKKQQSAYFKQTHRRHIDVDTNHNKIPLISPSPLPFVPPTPDRVELLSIVKEKLRPQLQKRSTMDEETSRENHVNNWEIFSQSERQEGEAEGKKRQERKGNHSNDMTFSGRSETVCLSREFRSNQPTIGQKQDQMDQGKLQERLKQETLPIEERTQLLHQLGKVFCEIGNYPQSQQSLSKAFQLLKQGQLSSLRFQILSLLGCVLLLQQKYPQAISHLLKAVRLEVAGEGAESVKLVQPYYWLGESYLAANRATLAKEYLNKSLRGYSFHALNDPELLQNLHLKLGIIAHSEEEYAEADKHYARGIKAAQQGGRADRYPQLLLRRAQNLFSMESYKLSIAAYAGAFRAMRRQNLTHLPLHQQARTSLSESLQVIATACISQQELSSVLRSAEQCQANEQQIIALRKRLQQMRSILYRQ